VRASRTIVTAALASSLLAGVATAADYPAVAAPLARTFANCTAMHHVYPHGVGRTNAHDHVTSGTPVTNFKHSNALYAANTKSDRDHDHIACEAH
jgi:hypothetical protein